MAATERQKASASTPQPLSPDELDEHPGHADSTPLWMYLVVAAFVLAALSWSNPALFGPS